MADKKSDDIKAEKIMKVLTEWNPLGNEASLIPDLDNYRTESWDILLHIDFVDANTDSKVITVVKNILNDAFDLALTRDECKMPGKEIFKIIYKQG